MQVVIEVLTSLSTKDPKFLDRFAGVKHGKKRRYVARRREDLYPDRPDLSKYAERLSDEYWIGTNFANREKRRMLEVACEVAGIQFGKDLTIDFE